MCRAPPLTAIDPPAAGTYTMDERRRRRMTRSSCSQIDDEEESDGGLQRSISGRIRWMDGYAGGACCMFLTFARRRTDREGEIDR